MADLLVDLIASLDGNASAEGWPGWWGLESPEYLAWLGEQPRATLLMGATTYRVMSRLADEGEPGTEELARMRSHVFSRTLKAPLSWPGATLLDAVHAGLVEAFRIPVKDQHARLVVHAPHRLAGPPDLAHPELMTMVTVDCFAGRSVEAKRALYAALVRRLGELGVPADHVSVLLRESALENWGIRGGQAACDVDLGFTVTV